MSLFTMTAVLSLIVSEHTIALFTIIDYSDKLLFTLLIIQKFLFILHNCLKHYYDIERTLNVSSTTFSTFQSYVSTSMKNNKYVLTVMICMKFTNRFEFLTENCSYNFMEKPPSKM